MINLNKGFTLIELVIVIILVSITSIGVMNISSHLAVQNNVNLEYKQAEIIADNLLDELNNLPFTYCDPSDVLAATNDGSTGKTTCNTYQSNSYNGNYNHIGDYNGYSVTSIKDSNNAAIQSFVGYRYSVVVNKNANNDYDAIITVTTPSNASYIKSMKKYTQVKDLILH